MAWTAKKTVVAAAVIGVAILLVLCILGIAAAVGIRVIGQARENARERQKQAKAMKDMREAADLVYKYKARHGRCPNWGNRDEGFRLYDENDMREYVYEDLQMHGITIRVEFHDPWNNDYQYGVNGASDQFVIVCKGSDGVTTMERLPDAHVGTHCFEDDIIWLDDGFIQEPEGGQKKCK